STRTRALTTSAVVQITVTTGALLTGAGLWAAPAGLGAGTLAGWITIRPVRNHPQMTATGECAPLRSWVTSRFGVTGMTFWLTQADRFVITAVAGETAVAAYDIAWRTTAIPKLLASSLTQTLVADINTSSQPLALL